MILVIYSLILLTASAEDCRNHTVSSWKVLAVWVLGLLNIVTNKENRWVTVTLTCICFLVLCLIYYLLRRVSLRWNCGLRFGGADVRLIPAMMLVQGWDTALCGVFAGLCGGLFYYFFKKKRKADIPLVPWMSAGCVIVEIFYLFSEKSML